MRSTAILLIAMMLTALAAGCGGGSPTTPAPTADAPAAGLPSLGELAHQASVVDNDTAAGNAYIDAQNHTNSGSAVMLDAPDSTPADMAYAIYSIPERPGETPLTITANALYYDTEPYYQEETEGYWIAYGDFTGGGEGVWRFDGPFMQYQGRVMIPAGVDVINDSGNIFVAVLLVDGARMKLGNVQVGYDQGEGYEAYRLMAPRGGAVGREPQVVINGDDEPQIAYLQSAINFGDGSYSLKIATHSPGGWETEALPLAYPLGGDFMFACGDGGRRALIVTDDATEDLHFLFDDGSGGGFSHDAILWPAHTGQCVPGLAFINGLDDPLGELDTALAVFDGAVAWPDSDIHYYCYDGVNPPDDGMFMTARTPGKLNLMVEDNQATLCIPVTPAYPQIDGHFRLYNSTTDCWLPSPIPDWIDIKVENDYASYGFEIKPMGGGTYTGAYIAEVNDNIIFGYFDGVAWATQPEQLVSCARPQPYFDFALFSDGTAVFPTYYSGFNLAVYEGMAGDGNPFAYYPFPDPGTYIYETSIAMDSSDTAHIAASNPATANLLYCTYSQGGTLNMGEVVDAGGDSFGVSYGPSGVVYTDDALHIFSADTAHLRLLHSENVDGTWVRESQPITPFNRYVYLLLGSGYLETTGQIWVAFMDALDLGVYVSYAEQQSGGDWDWHTYRYLSMMYEPLGMVVDDGTNIATTYYTESPLGDTMAAFTFAPLGVTPESYEIVSFGLDLLMFPHILSRNPVDGSWNLLTTHENERQTYLWHRAGYNDWQGPYLIAASEDTDDNVIGGALTYAEGTGLARVVVYNYDHSADRHQVSVYGQTSAGSYTFAAPITFFDVDAATDEFGGFGCVPDADGNPFMCIASKPVADPTHDVVFYGYDGLGNWLPVDTWDSLLENIWDMDVMYNPLAMAPDGRYAFAATEMKTGAAGFGRIWVYYPW